MSQLLDRRPLTHGNNLFGSQYDFDTLIVRHPDEILVDDEPGAWFRSSALAHEGLHWHQHHGSSLGAFLSGVRLAQAHLVLALRSIPSSLTRFWTHAGEGRPFVDIGADGRIAESLLDNDPVLRFLRRAWFRLQQVYALFLDSDGLAPHWTVRPIDVADAVLTVEAMYEYLATGSGPPTDYEKVDAFESRMTDRFEAVLDSTGRMITARTLLEAACLAAEAHHLEVDAWYVGGKGAFGDDATVELEKRLSSGPIALVVSEFRRFIDEAGFLNVRRQDVVRTFILLVNLALNPPLPPLARYGGDIRGDFDIDSVLPSNRFRRLVQRLLVIGLYRGELDGQRMLGYWSDACDAAGLDPVGDYSHTACGSQLATADRLHDGLAAAGDVLAGRVGGIGIEMHGRYLAWAQCNYWRDLAVILPHSLFGAGARFATGVGHVHLPELDPDSLWIRPVVTAVGDQRLVSPDPAFGLNVVASAAQSWAAWTLVARGVFDMRSYPPSCSRLASAAAGKFLSDLRS